MAERDGEKTAEAAADTGGRLETSTMTDRQLAEAVLARTIRPRVGEIIRLAEAVVAKAKKAPKKGKTARSGKLAKIPGQSKKKKKKG